MFAPFHWDYFAGEVSHSRVVFGIYSESVEGDQKNFTNFIGEQGTEQGAWRCSVRDLAAPATLLKARDSR
jgi:hypothetical protein